jgi:hypothetical protein
MKPFQSIFDKLSNAIGTKKIPTKIELAVKYNRVCVDEFAKAFQYLHDAVHKNKPLGLYACITKNQDFIDMVLTFNKKKVDDQKYKIFKNQLQMFVDRLAKEHFKVSLHVTATKVTFDFQPK